MQTLPLALFIVLLELTVGSYVSLWLLDLRGDSSRGFIIFQGVLYMGFALLTLGAMNAFATPEITQGYGLDETWIRAQGPLTLAFALALLPWNILLWADRADTRFKRKPNEAVAVPTPLRLARFAVGALTALLGLLAVFVVGMGYRTLADSRLGGAFVVLAFLAGAFAIGGVMTAMLLGHWYLNTPTASGKPLEFTTALLLAALVAELLFTVLTGPSTAHATLSSTSVAPGTTIQTNGGGVQVSTPTAQPGGSQSQQPAQAEPRQTPIQTGAMYWLEYLMGFLAPLILGAVALYLTRGRSFQSATGMLYLCVAFIFLGEILGRGLLLIPIF